VFEEGRAGVDWGGLANLSLNLGGSGKVGIKTLYTRTAYEEAIGANGFDTENGRVLRGYQVDYVEQDFYQSQLYGDHILWGMRIGWKGSLGFANRDEPDNRQTQYILDESTGKFNQTLHVPSRAWDRSMHERIATAQFDWQIPFGLWQPKDGEFKFGGLLRDKGRDFGARLYRWRFDPRAANASEIAVLPPEEAFAPENMGWFGAPFTFESTPDLAQSYQSSDDLTAAYAMLDVPLLRGVRVIGGVRMEDWRLDVDVPADNDTTFERTQRRNRDWLGSGNLTISLSSAMNLRTGIYRTVTRPDAREVSPDVYIPVAGECNRAGNPEVQRSTVMNLDVRWELYPRPGELVSVSGFHKNFEQPIVETVYSPGGGDCQIEFNNATSAVNYGVEVEWRKALDFLPGFLGNLSSGFNFTYVETRVTIDSALGLGVFQKDLPLQGQSPFLVNGLLAYEDPSWELSATVLANYYDDRVTRYGILSGGKQTPNTVERGRFTLDAKIQKQFGNFSLSVSGVNLTDAAIEFYRRMPSLEDPNIMIERITGSYTSGVKVSVGMGYEFF
jgi:TonB-dependent receptor